MFYLLFFPMAFKIKFAIKATIRLAIIHCKGVIIPVKERAVNRSKSVIATMPTMFFFLRVCAVFTFSSFMGISFLKAYPLTTAMGTNLATLVAMPTLSLTSATISTFLYAASASSASTIALAARVIMPLFSNAVLMSPPQN